MSAFDSARLDTRTTDLRSLPDAALAKRAGQGDSLAFGILAQRLDRPIRFHVRSLHGHHPDHDQDDLTQLALLGLLKACKTYRPRGASFRTVAELCIRQAMLTTVYRRAGVKFQAKRDQMSIGEEDHGGDWTGNWTTDPVSMEDAVVARMDVARLARELPGRLTDGQRANLAQGLNGGKRVHWEPIRRAAASVLDGTPA